MVSLTPFMLTNTFQSFLVTAEKPNLGLKITIAAGVTNSMSFVVMGLNIYASSFFTALGNGLLSMIISFMRTLLFQVICVLVLPLIWELNGIWFAIVVAESMALILSFVLLTKNKKKYGY